jgi:peptidylprolyl isomerase
LTRSEHVRLGEAELLRHNRLLAIATAILISLSGCGGGATPQPQQVAPPPPAASPVAQASPTLAIVLEPAEPQQPPEFVEVDKPAETTGSGLQYIELEEGTGPMPQSGQTVAVHYTGWLRNGVRFDSSWERGRPLTFPVGTGQVIPGWDEGVSTMKVGGKRRLIIPARLAYGSSGNGPIPPNATIVFDVELVAIAG